MPGYEKLKKVVENVAEAVDKWVDDLIVGDDRPANWRARFRVNDEKEWRGVDGQKRRVTEED
jgi:hypothetical protein